MRCIVEVITDKAAVEVPAPISGRGRFTTGTGRRQGARSAPSSLRSRRHGADAVPRPRQHRQQPGRGERERGALCPQSHEPAAPGRCLRQRRRCCDRETRAMLPLCVHAWPPRPRRAVVRMKPELICARVPGSVPRPPDRPGGTWMPTWHSGASQPTPLRAGEGGVLHLHDRPAPGRGCDRGDRGHRPAAPDRAAHERGKAQHPALRCAWRRSMSPSSSRCAVT